MPKTVSLPVRGTYIDPTQYMFVRRCPCELVAVACLQSFELMHYVCGKNVQLVFCLSWRTRVDHQAAPG